MRDTPTIDTSNIPTGALLDEEAKQVAEHRALIGRVTLEVEALLLEHDLTMGDWSEIVTLFNERSISHFSKVKIKTIKENYEV
jgi:hypothetical protein